MLCNRGWSDLNTPIAQSIDINMKFVSDISYGIGGNVYMYKLKDWSGNELSNNVGKFAYMQANNKLKFLNQNRVLKDQSLYSEMNFEYKKFNDIGINNNLPYVGTMTLYDNDISAQYDCNLDASCIGYVENSSSYYNIKDSSLNYLYYDISASIPSKFYQKIYGISFDEYIMDSSANNYMSKNISFMNNLERDIKDTDTGLKHPNMKSMLEGQLVSLEQKRTEFQAAFNDVVTKFNDLNEDELKILEQTGISIERLNKAVRQYKELYYNKDISTRYRQMFDSQKESTSKMYDRSQYIMALTGIVSIVSAMFLFESMK